MSSRPFVLAAGGTAGHLFPAEALASALIERGRSVTLLTDARADAFAGRLPEIHVHRVHAGRLGGGAINNAHALAELAFGTLQARRRLLRLAPAAVIGFGGYPSVPTMLAAVYLGLPSMIHEQNAVLGRANRLLASRVRKIATSFAATAALRPADLVRAEHCGNPVRPAILAVGKTDYEAPAPGGRIELLVIGGSQGARILSEVVPPALATLPPRIKVGLRVTHQARPEDLAAAAEIYSTNGIDAELQSFFRDIPERLARAHLAICRSGASTVAELAAIGRPAILIPYPYATDDHQTANARAFAEAGAGWVVPQADLHPGTLAARLERLLGDREALSTTARRSADFGRRDAARHLVRLALELETAAKPQGRAA